MPVFRPRGRRLDPISAIGCLSNAEIDALEEPP